MGTPGDGQPFLILFVLVALTLLLVVLGFVLRRRGKLELTPKAVRRLGETALRRVFASLESGRRGDHDQVDAGSAGELTGSTRPWRFGDEQPIDVVRTVINGVRRGGSGGCR